MRVQDGWFWYWTDKYLEQNTLLFAQWFFISCNESRVHVLRRMTLVMLVNTCCKKVMKFTLHPGVPWIRGQMHDIILKWCTIGPVHKVSHVSRMFHEQENCIHKVSICYPWIYTNWPANAIQLCIKFINGLIYQSNDTGYALPDDSLQMLIRKRMKCSSEISIWSLSKHIQGG